MKIKNIILMIIIAFIYNVFNYPKAVPEISLIPKNYTGEVFVIFDQKIRVSIEYEKKIEFIISLRTEYSSLN